MAKKLTHILYVDDEAHIQEVAQMCLEVVGGFTVTCLNNGHDAVENLPVIKPDLLLLDVMMPQMDGPATLRALQEHYPVLPPVVFMTARVQPEEIDHYMAMGVAGVISKPFDAMKLSEQITQIWETLDGMEK